MPDSRGHDPLQARLVQLWKDAQPEIERRLGVIEHYAVEWRQGQAGDELRRTAHREAHRMAGSLAILGVDDATAVARQLTLLLRDQPEARGPDEVEKLLTVLRGQIARVPTPTDSQTGTPMPSRSDWSARVLLADDDISIAAAVRVSLQLDGVELLWARDGAHALELAREQTFDLVILDLDLPVINGLQVCKALREDLRLATIPILVMTGHHDPERELSAYPSCWVNHVLPKPFQVAELRRRVRALLADRPDGSAFSKAVRL
jgi:CheY-like chemotaxis protein